MRIAEIFYSIQGEGPAMGKPATFVRLAGCNLKCEGCDTPIDRWHEMSSEAILEKIVGDRVIITGGEPTLQMDELSELILLLHRAGREIHIETNGVRPIPKKILRKLHCVVVSPKLGSDIDLAYWYRYENVHLKFVIGPAPWCWPSRSLQEMVPSLPRKRVWIMPFGADPETKGSREAWDLALHLGCNYSDRLHIRAGRR